MPRLLSFCSCLVNFNSIKVRLERLWGLPTAPISGFQFHKGTIRTKVQFVNSGEIRDFNSIKVRLELVCRPDIVKNILFQFHKGTIRTYL